MDTIKSKYHETLAATVIKNLEKRQMEGYYCPTVEDAEKLAFSFLKDGQTVSFGGSMTLEETGMLTALRHDPSIHLIDRSTAKTPDETKKNVSRRSFQRRIFYEYQCNHNRWRACQHRWNRKPCCRTDLWSGNCCYFSWNE